MIPLGRKKISAFVAAPLACCLALYACDNRPKNSEPSLSETLAWLTSSYNGADVVSGNNHEEDLWDGSTVRRRTETIRTSGCELTLTTRDEEKFGEWPWVTNEYVDKFNLKDIDLGSVELDLKSSRQGGAYCTKEAKIRLSECDVAEIQFKTLNLKPQIFASSRVISPHASGGTGQNSSGNFGMIVLSNVDYARRFEKAFRHAVELCGGKSAPF